MKYSKIIKPLVVSCLLPLAFSANAEDKMMKPADFNFVTVKAGIDQPVVNNNADVNSVNTTYLGGIEVGRSFMDIFAVSVEYNHVGKSKFNINSDNEGNGVTRSYDWGVKSDLFLANISANLAKNTDITPYVKLGLGASRNTTYNYIITESGASSNTMTYAGKTKTNFAWRLGLGANMAFNEKMDLDISYAFTDRGKVETNSSYYDSSLAQNVVDSSRTVKLKDHAVMVGIKYKF